MTTTTEPPVRLNLSISSGTPILDPGEGIRASASASTTRLFSPNGLSLPGSNLGGTALELSLFNRFLQRNVDLLAIIDQDPALVERARVAGFQDREDLQRILLEAVAADLPEDSPVTRRFLEGSPGLTTLLALNPGELRGRIARSETLQDALVDGDTIQTAIQDLVNREAVQQTGSLGGLDLEFFQANPLAASFLLDRPAETRRIAADTTGATGTLFRQRFFFDRNAIETAVFDRASALLDNVTTYSDDFLRDDPAFATLVVGANRLESHSDLVTFLRTERGIALDGVDVGSILRLYEVDKAVRSLSDGPIDASFLSRNIGLALVINEDRELREALVQDPARFRALDPRANSPQTLTNTELYFQIYTRATNSGAQVDVSF